MSRFSSSVWAGLTLAVWSLVALADGTAAAPPPSVLVVLALGIALAAARNRRMRTTGRLLLAFLAVIFASAALGAERSAVALTGFGLSAVLGALAVFELVRGRT